MKVSTSGGEIKAAVSFNHRGYSISVTNITSWPELAIFKGGEDLTRAIMRDNSPYGCAENIAKAVRRIDARVKREEAKFTGSSSRT